MVPGKFDSFGPNWRGMDLMDHLVDKKLAGWSYLKSCGQWLNVQGDPIDKCLSSGVDIGIGAI